MTRVLSNGMNELAFRLNEAVGTWEQVRKISVVVCLWVSVGVV